MAKIKISKPKKLPEYPADHKVGIEVPINGSDCQKCEYWSDGECHQKLFIQWNGSGKIPTTPDRFCCDFFETR